MPLECVMHTILSPSSSLAFMTLLQQRRQKSIDSHATFTRKKLKQKSVRIQTWIERETISLKSSDSVNYCLTFISLASKSKKFILWWTRTRVFLFSVHWKAYWKSVTGGWVVDYVIDIFGWSILSQRDSMVTLIKFFAEQNNQAKKMRAKGKKKACKPSGKENDILDNMTRKIKGTDWIQH